MAGAQGQQHPIRIYLVIWGWLFILSAASYMVDYAGIEGYPRWFLILAFMLAKAGLIIAVFMHMLWERATLRYAILAPPFVLLVLVGLMVLEAEYTLLTRYLFFAEGS